MGKIFLIMGKSSSGKDTIFQELGRRFPSFKKVVPYTTRPIRKGEKEGEEYFFVKEGELLDFQKQEKIIECRTYSTLYGRWSYFTADDGQICLGEADYLMIGTLESYKRLKEYFGENRIVPLYIEVEDGERLIRAARREKGQEKPCLEEVCRRFLADADDFSEERLCAAGIKRRFLNDEKEKCLKEIAEVINDEKL